VLSKNVKITIYRITNFECIFIAYGCDVWSQILSDELRLRVFEKRMLMRIFGPKRDEI
jgi:hypothetical protein